MRHPQNLNCLIEFKLVIFTSLISVSPTTQGHLLFRRYQYSSTPVWLTAIGLLLIFKPLSRKGVIFPLLRHLCARKITIASIVVILPLSLQSHRASCPKLANPLKMNLRQLLSYVWILCETTARDYSRKCSLSNRFLRLSTSQLYTRTCSRARSMPQSERISLCSISMIIPGVLLRYEVRGQGLTMTNLEETKTSSTLLRPKDAVRSLRVPPPYQRNASPTSHSSPGSQTMILTAQLLLPVRNLLGNWYRTMCLTSRHPNAWSSGPNVSLNSPIPSGTTSWQERRSTLTSFSQACTPPSRITGLSKTSETSNCTLVPRSQPRLSKLMETGSWHGELFSEPRALFFLIGRQSLRSIMTTLPHTLHQYTRALI